MGESHHQAATSSRLGMRNTGGEIVEVQGGHIVRSTGRKDRHSKVCTAKGPRDRRVRLSAHTAIQFYDVQDRLGYDRPSKAVDWLIKKAKPAIDELAELPAWNPTTISATTTTTSKTARRSSSGTHQQQQQDILMGDGNSRDYQFSMDNHLTASAAVAATGSGSTSRTTVTIAAAGVGTSTRGGATGILGTNNDVQNAMAAENHNPSNSSSFLPPSLDSDAIADTIKSFFPIGVPAETSSSIQFQNYPPDLLSRTSSQNQDLRLSLQSFQEPILLQQHHHQSHHHHGHNEHGQQQVIFSGHLGFDGGSYQPADHINRFQRMVALTAVTSGAADHTGGGGGGGGGGGESGSGGGGFIFNALPPTMSSSPLLPLLQPLFGGGGGCEFSSQRGPLQSSNMPSVRAWTDPAAAIITAADHQIPQIHQQQPQQHSAIIPGIGFVAPAGCSGIGFSGFRIPARIRGEEEEHDGSIPDKPSSASSDSRH